MSKHVLVSVRVGATVAGLACGLALVLAFLGKPEVLTTGQTLVLAATLAAGAFGGGLDIAGGVDATVGFAPLTLTIVALGAGLAIFRRAGGGLIDAAATAVVTTVPLVLVAAAFRTEVAGMEVGVDVVSTLWRTPVVVFAVLALSTFVRFSALRGPLRGLAVLVGLLPVAGAVALLSLLIGEGTGALDVLEPTLGEIGLRHEVAAGVAFAGNAGVAALALGSWGEVGRLGFDTVGALVERIAGIDDRLGGRLTGYTDGLDLPGLWVCVVLAPLVLVLALLAARRGTGWRGSAGLVVALVVALPALNVAANLHVGVDAGLIGDSGGFGVRSMTATALVVGYAAVLAVLVAVAARLRGTGPSTPRRRRPSEAAPPTGSASHRP